MSTQAPMLQLALSRTATNNREELALSLLYRALRRLGVPPERTAALPQNAHGAASTISRLWATSLLSAIA
jgi:hypothetical protein